MKTTRSMIKGLGLRHVLLLGSLLTCSVWAEEDVTVVNEVAVINMQDADIRQFINQVSDITGKSFIIDPRVKGKVTVISKEQLNDDEAYQLFLAVLHVHNYAAVPSGDVIKIVPSQNAKQDTIPFNVQQGKEGEEIITRVIAVENTPAAELVPILRPMVPQYGHLAAVPSANALIVSDHASNINRLEAIVSQLDGAESEELFVMDLNDAWVGDVVDMLQSLTPVETGKKGGKASAYARVRVVADERTNRLLIKGDKAARQRIVDLVRKLDAPAKNAGGVQVIRLSYADAKDTAEILKGLQQGAVSGKSKGKSKSTPAQQVSILADEATNSLIVRAEAAVMREIKSVIAQLDVRRSQVLIEAAIVEVGGSAAKDIGVLMAQLDENKPVGGISFNNGLNNVIDAVVGLTPPAIKNGITIGAGKTNSAGKLEYAALLQAIVTSSSVNLLSTPNIMTMDNQEAYIIVGENVPYETGSTAGSNNANPFTTVERMDVGISLRVTPHINDDNTVRLEITQEASAVKKSASETANALITSKREIKTTILADAGQTVALGGLIQDDVQESVSKVPILGDIPILGILFRSTNTSRGKSNLVVFLRATILQDKGSIAGISDERYLGIKTMQFKLDEYGDLFQLGQVGYPQEPEEIFEGLLINKEHWWGGKKAPDTEDPQQQNEDIEQLQQSLEKESLPDSTDGSDKQEADQEAPEEAGREPDLGE